MAYARHGLQLLARASASARRRAPERLEHPEVGGGERVGVAEAKREVLRGPRADAREGAELLRQALEGRRPVERDLVLGNGGRERPNRGRSPAGHGEVGVGEGRRVGEPRAEPERLEPRCRRAVGVHDLAHRRRRAADAHLLADDRSHAGLERVPRARHAQPVRPRRERRVSCQRVRDLLGLMVEIEQPSHPRHVVDEPVPGRKVEPGDELVTVAPHLEGAGVPVDVDRAAVDVVGRRTRHPGRRGPRGTPAARSTRAAAGR